MRNWLISELIDYKPKTKNFEVVMGLMKKVYEFNHDYGNWLDGCLYCVDFTKPSTMDEVDAVAMFCDMINQTDKMWVVHKQSMVNMIEYNTISDVVRFVFNDGDQIAYDKRDDVFENISIVFKGGLIK